MITSLLLAAGRARRFGSQKLLAKLPGGNTVVAASLENLRAAGGRVLAVIGEDPELRAHLGSLGCEFVVNELAEQGMGTSIARGIAASADSAGWLIALGDMPYVKPASILAVKAALVGSTSAGSTIVVPRHEGRQGHPVGFGADFRVALVGLGGDRGARAVLEAHPGRLFEIELSDPGILQDIDLPADIR